MQRFELMYLLAEPFLPPLPRLVRHRLLALCKAGPQRMDILDVGGRKSHYTIGVPASITISDLPRVTAVHHRLNLGITDEIMRQTYARRSNVGSIVLDDMTHSSFADSSFHYVVAMEVLEHVEEDTLFVRQVRRVLKPGGIFLMTTPNGDFVPNTNPDHKRHYTQDHLQTVLAACFDEVQTEYAMHGGRWYALGLKSWSIRHPCQTAICMCVNFLRSLKTESDDLKDQPEGANHLIAVAKAPG